MRSKVFFIRAAELRTLNDFSGFSFIFWKLQQIPKVADLGICQTCKLVWPCLVICKQFSSSPFNCIGCCKPGMLDHCVSVVERGKNWNKHLWEIKINVKKEILPPECLVLGWQKPVWGWVHLSFSSPCPSCLAYPSKCKPWHNIQHPFYIINIYLQKFPN